MIAPPVLFDPAWLIIAAVPLGVALMCWLTYRGRI